MFDLTQNWMDYIISLYARYHASSIPRGETIYWIKAKER